MTDQKLSFIKSLLITGGFIATIVTVMITTIPRVDKYLKLKAFDDCAKATSYTYESTKKDSGETTKSTEPVKGFYITCITDKGYTTKAEQK